MEPIVIEFSIEIKGVRAGILANAAIDGIVEAMEPIAFCGGTTRIVELQEKAIQKERGSITFWPNSKRAVRKFVRMPL